MMHKEQQTNKNKDNEINPLYAELNDVTHLIVPEEEPKYLSDEEALELYQTCIHIMEEYIKDNPTAIAEEDFDEVFDCNVKELIMMHFEGDAFFNDCAMKEIDDVIHNATVDFFDHHYTHRSYDNTFILEKPDYEFITEQLEVLRNKPQPTQRTKEWYEFRHNLITASNAYKAFENQTVKNQLICEKCQPIYVADDTDVKEITMVNVNSPLHWGQKYEPLSVKIYEHKYNTKIDDFGCIKHEKYNFIGASPDGINVDINSSRYGRMLEIKNVVSREIDGIPKKEYWIQMQLQMEVCDLDECDFLETKFVEYNDFDDFLSDVTSDVTSDEINVCMSNDDCMKGLIIYFHTKEGKPFYDYKPLEITSLNDIEQWQENSIEKYQNSDEYNYTFMKTIYWKLEQISCVLVCRNRQWFNDNIQTIKEVWDIIEKERISGFEHRMPNKKKKDTKLTTIEETITNKCLLKINKEPIKINVIKSEN